MAEIIDGKAVAAAVRAKLKERIKTIKENNVMPGLAVILVGNNPASRVYVNNKKKACAALGILSEEYALEENTQTQELLALIDTLNKREDIHGILVQLPLPKHIPEKLVLDAISPDKDVDAFHPVNVGKMMIGDGLFAPCTPSGIIELIESTGQSIEGRECVVIGRSNIVGKPMAMLMLHKNATVTICHSRTKNLAEVTRRADILIVAIGRAKFVGADMVKDGAIVIDVGMDRDEEGKLCGDVDFEAVEKKASYITPVPGGVGPMTIAMLMSNTVAAAERFAGLR